MTRPPKPKPGKPPAAPGSTSSTSTAPSPVTPVNAEAVASILKIATVPVQLGGGIRDRAGIEAWLEAGITRVILGSAAVKDPDLVLEACRAHPDRIAVGIDARDGIVATDGWAESSGIKAIDLALRFEDSGVAAIIYTDIGRDGMLTGFNLDATLALADRLQTPVIASGGAGSLKDLRQLADRAGLRPRHHRRRHRRPRPL